MIGLSGCFPLPNDEKKKDPWLDFYTKDLSSHDVKKVVQTDFKKYSFSANDMNFPLFIRLFSDKTGTGIIYSSEADSYKITAEFKNNTPEEIMSMIARRFDFELIKSQNTFYLGKLKPEDKGIYVKKIGGYGQADIQSAISVFLSEFGKVFVQKDGVVIVADREKVLQRVVEMLEYLENSTDNSWIIQYYLISQRKELKIQAGGDLKTSGTLAYNYNKESGFNYSAKDLGQSLEVVLNLSSDLIQVHGTPMFLLRDGTSSYWQDGTSYPIPKKTVSDYGTVTTNGYEYKDVGLLINTTLRECKSGATLTVDIQDSNITGYVDLSQPILSKTQIKTETIVKSGHIYLIGEFNMHTLRGDESNVFDFTASTGKVAIQLFCRAYKIERYINKASETKQDVMPATESGELPAQL